MSKTFWSACESVIARLIVVVVLPSFGDADDTTIVLHPFFIIENIMFALMLLYASSTLNRSDGSIEISCKRCLDEDDALFLLFLAIAVNPPYLQL